MSEFFQFFQQAMLGLLGSKDISHGLVNLFSVLHEEFGLDGLTFDRYDPVAKQLRVHYVVTHQGFFESDLSISLSKGEEAIMRRNEAELLLHLSDSNWALPLTQRHSRALIPYIPLRERAYMVGVLQVEGLVIGHLCCLGQVVGAFTNRHARLLTMLLPACALAISNMLNMQTMFRQNAFMQSEQGRLRRELGVLANDDMVGAQGGLRHVVNDVRKLANLDVPVLILGETGTGKELVADAIQKHSSRHGKPYVKINCGALTDTLLDNELFGHEKGAFTGATSSHQGRFEQADGGTLLLDEVGELSALAQVRLLRVLQNGTFERIGGRRPVNVNVRIIAATNRDLQAMCRQGLFREDLYHRLNVFPLHLPPLRERREDIPLLLRHLGERAAVKLGLPQPAICMEHLDRLMSYTWPGNVRELQNLVERSLILSNGESIDLGPLVPASPEEPALPEADGLTLHPSLETLLEAKFTEWQRRLVPAHDEAGSPPPERAGLAPKPFAPTREGMADSIRKVLVQCNGKIYGPGGAAERLGVNHNTLRSRMRRLGILAADVRNGSQIDLRRGLVSRGAGDREPPAEGEKSRFGNAADDRKEG